MVARALTLAFAVITGAAAPPLAIAAGETSAEFIQTLGKDLLAEMSSAASLDQKEAYFHQMLRQDFDMDEIARFVLGPYWRTASPAQQQNSEPSSKITSCTPTVGALQRPAAATSA